MLSFNSLEKEYFLLQEILPFESFTLKKPPSPEEKLQAMEIVYAQALVALSDFSQKKLFDPSVGDNLCEIRAYQLIILSNQDLSQELQKSKRAFIENLKKIKKAYLLLKENEASKKEAINQREVQLAQYSKRNKEIGPILYPPNRKPLSEDENPKLFAEFNAIKKEQKTIQEAIKTIQQGFLSQAYKIASAPDLDVKISTQIDFMIKSFLLSKVKQEEITVTPSKEAFIVDHLFVRGLSLPPIPYPTKIFEVAIPLLKKSLVKLSADLVQQEAAKVSTDKEMFMKVFSKRRGVGKKNQEEIPFYYTLRLIYLRAIEQGIPVVFKIRSVKKYSPTKKEAFIGKGLFKVDRSNTTPQYDFAQVTQEDLSKLAIIVEAFSSQNEEGLRHAEFLKNIFNEGGGLFHYLTELDAAQHTQYTDQQEDSSVEALFDTIPEISVQEKQRLVARAKEANNLGFSKTNCSKCCVEHVFADLIGNQLAIKNKE